MEAIQSLLAKHGHHDQFPGAPLQRKTMVLWTDTSTSSRFPWYLQRGLASRNRHKLMTMTMPTHGQDHCIVSGHWGWDNLWFSFRFIVLVRSCCSLFREGAGGVLPKVELWAYFGGIYLYRWHLLLGLVNVCHTEFILGVTQYLWPQRCKFYEPYFYCLSCCGVSFAILEIIFTIANIRVVFLLPSKLAGTMPLAIVLSAFVLP